MRKVHVIGVDCFVLITAMVLPEPSEMMSETKRRAPFSFCVFEDFERRLCETQSDKQNNRQ